VTDDAREVGSDDLLAFLELVEGHLDWEIKLVAAGGTALTLDAKAATIDIDFTGSRESIEAFREAEEAEPHGYEIDAWPDGTVFSLTLPADYLDRSIDLDAGLDRVELRTLHPVDLVVTKIARYNARDREDIQTTRKLFDVAAAEVEARASEVTYVGSQANLQANLETAIRECFESG
jgi:hypothetical protein